MQSSGSQPPSTPSEPSGPEITAAPSKRGLPRRTLVIIIVAIIILGAVGAFLFVYLGTGSVLVTSNSQFIPAGSSTSFTATVTPPSFVSVNSIQWNFGDGQQQAATGTNPSHSYSNPGNYYVLATASLSNGKTSDNSQGLFPVQVGDPPLPANPNPFGVARSFGILSFNKTLSSPGVPFVATGGHVAFVGVVGELLLECHANQVGFRRWIGCRDERNR